MPRNSIMNRIGLQRSSASKEIGYQNLKIDEPPGSLEGNHHQPPTHPPAEELASNSSAASTHPDYHISSSQYVANLHSVSPPPPRFRISRRPRYSRWCRCLCWTLLVFLILLILLGIGVLCFYLIVHPRMPQFDVQSVDMSSFLLTITDSNSSLSDYAYNSILDLDLVLAVSAYNPNWKIEVFYDRVRVDLRYQRLQLASAYVEPFVQEHREREIVKVELLGNPSLQKVVSRELSREMSENIVNLVVDVSAKGKVKVVRTVFHGVVVYLTCWIQVSPPTGPTGPQLLSKSCELTRPYTGKKF